MNEQKMQETIDTISNMKKNGVFKNYIEYIVFPYYKNLVSGTKLNFSFPLTVLIGKNGSGKSSTLHALFGAPQGYTCSDFWFSTDVDPIVESGDRNRYFYGYRENKLTEIKEVMKMRMRRGSQTKKEDLDYWETSRPIRRDGMLPSKRNSPVTKHVVYLDFRAEVSAFDKIYHFSKDDLHERKNLLRQRSVYLKRLFNEEPVRFRGPQANKVGTLQILSSDIVEKIGNILNKKYTEIRVAEHKLYKNSGTSVYIKTQYETGYSEANAGSGEIAVVQLVRRIEQAPPYSLILLDEPEVSLHPGAQENLKLYLLNAIKKKKLQIVISSHSTTLINGLPNSAIKLFKTNENGNFYVEEDINYEEAIFSIEDKVSTKKIIYCEDYAAQMLIKKSLNQMGKEHFFEVIYPHGGEKTLINHYLAPISLNKAFTKKVFFILDGDMNTEYTFEESSLPKQNLENADFLALCVKKAFGMTLDVYPDNGSGGKREDQKCEDYLKYLRYYSNNVFYLPGKLIPEELLLQSKLAHERYGKIIEKYQTITSKNAKDVIREISISEHGDDLHAHLNDTISILANKWSLEDNIYKNKLINDLNTIFEK